MSMDSITILPLSAPEHYQACEDLQATVWQAHPVEVIPAHVLITAQRHGGLVLGAFDPTGQMIGFLFGFLGTVALDNPLVADARLEHCSHSMGVHPQWQGRGVGYRLKCTQREWALRQGLELVTWTFDPLEAGNGTLNLGKLGALCRCYLRDIYGEMTEGINAGLPTDRFEVAWWVRSERVRARLEQGWQPPRLETLLADGAAVLNTGYPRADGWLEPSGPVSPAGEQVLVEIPARMQAIKAAAPDLSLAWRLNVRAACEAAFAAGYTACDVVHTEADGFRRVYYVLRSGIADPRQASG